MTENNKHNLLYFEASTMRGLFEIMDDWQKANEKRLLSVCVQKDGDSFCCLALSNPMEVVITCGDHNEVFHRQAIVHFGRLCVEGEHMRSG